MLGIGIAGGGGGGGWKIPYILGKRLLKSGAFEILSECACCQRSSYLRK